MKIRGWKKRKGSDKYPSWMSETIRGQVVSVEIDLGKWVFAVYGYPTGKACKDFNQGIAHQSKRYSNRNEAVKAAVNWMKRHPRGYKKCWK